MSMAILLILHAMSSKKLRKATLDESKASEYRRLTKRHEGKSKTMDMDAIQAESFISQPLIFDWASAGAEQYEELLRKGKVWQLHDTIEQQLSDLIKTRNPKQRMTDAEIQAEKVSLLKGSALREFGRWVYYPWSGRLVHLLPPAEFRELRLDRNNYKITPAEQARLANFCVGIIGLSVGNAVAISLALEEVCGHLKLADFDRLDLSNMNRLRADVAAIGLPKTVLLARQIYEFNPYACLSLFSQGITAQNLDEFLLGAPQLNVVVEECDDLAMKILVRERARTLQLPVLMETSDRGMMDVERFDLEPERALLHGLIGDIKAVDIGPDLSNEEKVRYILPMVGVETISTRAAASMVEIKETISTWPQLGSEVALGGAIVTTAVRRLALGQALPSGRHYVDIEAILSHQNQAEPSLSNRATASSPATTSDGPHAHDLSCIPEFIQFVVAHGILAPSAGNSQPWQFTYEHDELWVVHDNQRSKNLLDSEHRAAYTALGAAIQNIAIAAAHRGYYTQIKPFPQSGQRFQSTKHETIASLSFTADEQVVNSELAALFPLLRQRVTNRKLTQRAVLPSTQQETLTAVAAGYGCHLHFLTDEGDLAELGDILGEGERLRILCANLHAELMAEIRWTSEAVQQTQDGLDIASLELTASQAAVLKLLARPDVGDLLRNLRTGNALAAIARKAVNAASAMGLISVVGDTPVDMLRGGQAIEHVWLEASRLGWAWQPMTAIIPMFDMLNSPTASLFEAWALDRLADLSGRFNHLFAPSPYQLRLMLFRVAPASVPSARSLRRPVETVLFAR